MIERKEKAFFWEGMCYLARDKRIDQKRKNYSYGILKNYFYNNLKNVFYNDIRPPAQ